MIDPVVFILICLQLKHWYIDFVDQSSGEVRDKGIYLKWLGIRHSLKHGIATAIIFLIFVDPIDALILGFIDFFLHYHIDWCKMRFGNRDITTKAFWAQLGLDQLAHQLTYLGLISLLVI
jgi:hypothetical protein